MVRLSDLFPNLAKLSDADDLRFMRAVADQVAYVWAAALIDARGSISVSGRNKHFFYRVALVVSKTERDLLTPLRYLFGGSITQERVYGAGQRPVCRWSTTSTAQTWAALRAVQPYLILRLEHAQIAIEVCDLLANRVALRGRREQDDPEYLKVLERLRTRLAKLNSRGREK